MKRYVKKNLKFIIIAGIGILLIISGLLSWNLYFSKFQIFYKQEEMFLESVKRFYSMNKNHLPKTGETREKTLEDLYKGNHIEDLVIPKTDKLCDSNSWVRVYKDENGEYQYIVYLKCGKYESDIDNVGPEVVLNGEEEMIISLNSKYEEFGVKSVIDNVDGKLNIDNVVIDSSKVNTSKLGSYEVTYTVRDKTYNKTVKKRKVTVARNLTEIVKNSTDKTNYYKGLEDNNYILFSGMLFRIVNVNSDGTVKIISDDSISNLRYQEDKYKGSNVEKWLNDYYFNKLNNVDDYLVSSEYCVGNIDKLNNVNKICDTKTKSYVGLLDLQEFANTFSGNSSFLCSNSYYLLANKVNKVGMVNNCTNGKKYIELQDASLPSIRPVITLKSNLYLMSGDGTQNNPYKLYDYEYGKENDLITSRLVGEYFYHSGILFRISEVNKNNIKAIMAKSWINNTTSVGLIADLEKYTSDKFDPNNEKSIGYLLNQVYIDYIDSKRIISNKFEVPTNEKGKKYSDFAKEKVTAKISLPATYEMFASASNNVGAKATRILFIDKSSIDNAVYMLNGSNNMAFELRREDYTTYGIRATLYLDGSLKIKSGKGTFNNPYYTK